MPCCIACGGSSFGSLPYKNPPAAPTLKRFAIDALQTLGWKTLPLGLIAKTALGPRFAAGAFKFRQVVICHDCGLGKIDRFPTPRDLDIYYRHFYSIGAQAAGESSSVRGHAQSEWLGRILDFSAIHLTYEFGAGVGALSSGLKRKHPHLHCTAAEIGDETVAILKSNPLIDEVVPVYRGGGGHFDLVLSSHTLEHVVDAYGQLEEWRDLLKSGGHAFIEVPHANNDHYVVDYQHVPHLWFFTPQALRHLAQRLGLEVIAIATGGRTWRNSQLLKPKVGDAQWADSGEEGSELRVILRKP